jgi:6-phosphogluconate dehydrogenase (decarboxylating)
MTEQLQLGIIGLGKMGSSLSLQCVDRGIFVVGHSAHGHPALEKEGVHTTPDYDDLAGMLKRPRR